MRLLPQALQPLPRLSRPWAHQASFVEQESRPQQVAPSDEVIGSARGNGEGGQVPRGQAEGDEDERIISQGQYALRLVVAGRGPIDRRRHCASGAFALARRVARGPGRLSCRVIISEVGDLTPRADPARAFDHRRVKAAEARRQQRSGGQDGVHQAR